MRYDALTIFVSLAWATRAKDSDPCIQLRNKCPAFEEIRTLFLVMQIEDSFSLRVAMVSCLDLALE